MRNSIGRRLHLLPRTPNVSIASVPPSVPSAFLRIDATMLKTGFDPNTCRSNFLLRSLIRLGDLHLARQLFDAMPTRNAVSAVTMISGYVEYGHLLTAKVLLYSLFERTTVTWTILIAGYLKFDKVDAAFEIFRDMLRFGGSPDYVVFATLLSGVNDCSFLSEVIQVHALMVNVGSDSALIANNSLLDAYCKLHEISLGFRVFGEMSEKDSVTYNVLITWYINEALFCKAARLFIEMQMLGFKPSEFTFATILNAGISLGDLGLGKQVHCQVIKSNFLWNVFWANAMLDLYSKFDCANEARKLFNEMVEVDCISFNVIITGYAWEGRIGDCLELFDVLKRTTFDRRQFPFATLLSITANNNILIMGRQIHCQAAVSSACSEIPVANVRGLHEEGLKMFVQMHRTGIRADQATCSSVLKASAVLASKSVGKQLHSFVMTLGLQSDVYCASALVDMYAKSGSMKDAIKTFEEMPVRNIVCWNTLISAYAQDGDANATLRIFETMISFGLEPDFISFLSVISACSHGGLVEEGLWYFKVMSNMYRLVPSREHFSAVVDLLARSGRLNELETLMDNMPFEPDEIMWMAVLNSCRIYRNEALAKKASKMLFSMKELRDAASYVNMSNIYAMEGNWDGVLQVKRAMRESGVRKVPACSWVEVNHKTHVFMANDGLHPMMTEIRRKIDMLTKEMEEEGYSPDIGCAHHGVDDKDRMESLKYHCERLAIAFALIMTPEGKSRIHFPSFPDDLLPPSSESTQQNSYQRKALISLLDETVDTHAKNQPMLHQITERDGY
ncbi:hypothetical protein MLD38_025576 [Melastoma candidum]|uniref:Uncharacterized protein n=1 Tax=Melastoma candidum TaxID=119954 RepID=A0ACB9NVQ3_9MYRT|nr:hypothetical protein MLD38_025576 [Melastoma candidum]